MEINEDIQVFNGNCLDVLPELSNVDMVLTDPPYGTTQNKWDAVIPFEQMWEVVHGCSKETAAMCFTSSQPFSSALVMSNVKEFKHEWIWIKNRGSNFANTVREPMKEHEQVLVFSKGKWTYNKQMQPRTGGGAERVKYNVKFETSSDNYREFETKKQNKLSDLRVPSSWQKFNTQVGLHPTQKPVKLMEYMILTYTDPGDTVLDFCAGSFTTVIAAINTGRKFIGVELDKDYFESGVERIQERLAEITVEELQLF